MRLPMIASQLLNAPITSPRGLKTKEFRNFGFIVEEPYMTYACRNLSFDYMKAEAKWYLSGDPYNTSILDHGAIWSQIQQKDGCFYSNYGQYWFGEQKGFEWVVDQLIRDQDTRQAIIPMLSKDHMFEGNKDVVCTACINFHIRNGNKVHMTIIMRSSDFILGYAYDLPMFTMLHQMVVAELSKRTTLPYEVGEYYHMSMSLHVYEKHWDMLEKIADGEGHFNYEPPVVTDAYDLINGEFQSEFGRWLTSKGL